MATGAVPMVFVRPISEAERQELRRRVRREVGRISERMRAILLSSRGYSVPQIAAVFECDEATVREWIHRFEAAGIAGLQDRPRRGRARRTVLETRPALGGWTVVLL